MNETTGTFIISWDFTKGEGHERDALVVMQLDKQRKMKAVNAFYNEEAHDIYKRLTEKQEG